MTHSQNPQENLLPDQQINTEVSRLLTGIHFLKKSEPRRGADMWGRNVPARWGITFPRSMALKAMRAMRYDQMMCSTWSVSSNPLKSHQDGYGPTMAQLSKRVVFRILQRRWESAAVEVSSREGLRPNVTSLMSVLKQTSIYIFNPLIPFT